MDAYVIENKVCRRFSTARTTSSPASRRATLERQSTVPWVAPKSHEDLSKSITCCRCHTVFVGE